MAQIEIKLAPKLFDLFQHCEVRCNAGCCGWDAFDLSEHWLRQWCDFRDASIIAAARSDIERIRDEVSGCDATTRINIQQFFSPTAQSLAENLDKIEAVLAQNGHQ